VAPVPPDDWKTEGSEKKKKIKIHAGLSQSALSVFALGDGNLEREKSRTASTNPHCAKFRGQGSKAIGLGKAGEDTRITTTLP